MHTVGCEGADPTHSHSVDPGSVPSRRGQTLERQSMTLSVPAAGGCGAGSRRWVARRIVVVAQGGADVPGAKADLSSTSPSL